MRDRGSSKTNQWGPIPLARERTYLDWNATSPISPHVLTKMVEAAEQFWANPSSTHSLGQAAKSLIEGVRLRLADLLGAHPRDIIFTSGGTESNNWAVLDAPGLVLSRLEHPSIARVADRFEDTGKPVRWLDVQPSGQVRLDSLKACLDDMPVGTCVAVMAVNHETGVIQPIEEVASIAHRMEAWLHVDAVQAIGKLEPSAWSSWDSVSLGAHKIQGPKGIGALAWRCGMRAPRAGLFGGSQERGLRPGTLDSVSVAGFGAALEGAHDGPTRYRALAYLRNTLERSLTGLAEPNVSNDSERLGHVASLYVPAWSGAELVAALDLEGVCISSGSACAAGTSEVSPVITSMLGTERARSTVRISLGPATGESDIQRAIEAFTKVLARP
jgi:cysteine desulfurase